MKFLKIISPLNLSRTEHHISDHLLHNTAATIITHCPHPKAITLQVSNCTSLQKLRQIFAHIIRTHFLEFYPDSFHYNNIARTYNRLESPREASRVYLTMFRAGVLPDSFTLPVFLKSASQEMDVVLTKQAHSVAFKLGLETDMYCESGLISFYSKVGRFDDARKVFDENPDRKLGSWNAVICGLSQGGRAKEAVEMFVAMMRDGFSPDDVTMVSVISACGGLGDLDFGLQLHKFVFQVRRDERSDVLTMNSVIDMYNKCGRMDLACKVFDEMEVKNVSSWTTMIAGYAAQGCPVESLECFRSMREAGVRPNQVTFVGVLSACVHGGMVQEGKYYFNMMKGVYGIRPTLPHYGCMVDLLGRAGLLDEAMSMVEKMPMKPNAVIWGCLMGACEKYGNVEMGEQVAKHLIELEPGNDGVFVALSNIYASHGLWKEVERTRLVMKDIKLAKVPAYSLPSI